MMLLSDVLNRRKAIVRSLVRLNIFLLEERSGTYLRVNASRLKFWGSVCTFYLLFELILIMLLLLF